MSAAQPSASAAAAAASARSPPKKRPRHFWEGPDRTDERDEEKQGAAHVAPVTRLYRHALESVFGFLKLKDLSHVASVSRLWSAAVRSMASIHADVAGLARPLPHTIAASSLSAHVSELRLFHHVFSSGDLFILARHLGSLTSLRCTVQLDDESRVYFASTLRTLWLHLMGDEAKVPLINDAIVTVSQLPNLEDLTLTPPDCFPALTFAPLAAASQLRDLSLRAEFMYLTPTRHQLDQIRMLPRLRTVDVTRPLSDLVYLLRPPHSLQWQEIHMVSGIDDAAAVALSTLPSLTKLVSDGCRSVAFLPVLPRLRTLDLRMDDSRRLAADIVAGLSCCSELNELNLHAADVTSEHLSRALSRLSLLRKLSVGSCPALESLSFLSECKHLAQSLQSFELRFCRNVGLHSTDLKHVLTLKNLTALDLHYSFVDPLDSLWKHLLQPPTVVLPKLRNFSSRPN